MNTGVCEKPGQWLIDGYTVQRNMPVRGRGRPKWRVYKDGRALVTTLTLTAARQWIASRGAA